MGWRPFAQWSWDVRSCGRQGHATYRPDEPELAERLATTTPWGTAWRCLRCGDYVVGEPRGSGPADDAPIVLRGAALRDAFILRILSVDKLLRGIVILAAALAIWRFDGRRAWLEETFQTYLPLLAPIASRLGIRLQDVTFVHWIEQALAARSRTILEVAAGVATYGTLQLLEGTGLWLMKRWGEYVAVVGTSLFLPLEIYELVDKLTALRVAALVINLFLVVYLIWTKRLFGVRGGARAHHAALHTVSLLEVERAAMSEELGRPHRRPRAAS
ncbi:MAG TPA: DUF2127 domain-containing protein [Propionibacteriaceae bacterium]|nr:DUF2127 domain-containing protein [Propionibacteriaceae bacterium]